MKTIQSTTRWLGLALAYCTLFYAASAQAGKPIKPPKPPPSPPLDTGVVYASLGNDVYAVKPDGSGQQYLFTPSDNVNYVGIVPSRLTHNGERWFVGWRRVDDLTDTYPDGVTTRCLLIAMSESGDTVVLHDGPMLQPSLGSSSPLRWMPGDDAVSWPAMRWEGDTVVEYGIYTLDLQFAVDGGIAANTPTLLAWTAGLSEPWLEQPDGSYPGFYLLEYDWSPDASAIVYSAFSEVGGTQLYVADDDGYILQLTSDTAIDSRDPRWSPDGTRIVFELNREHQIDVINADGSERRTLITASRTDNRAGVFSPMWSPASTHVVYCNFTAGPRRIWANFELHIIAADGSGDSALTGALTTYAIPFGWCAQE